LAPIVARPATTGYPLPPAVAGPSGVAKLFAVFDGFPQRGKAMSTLRGAEQDRFLEPGTPVRLAIVVNEDDRVTPQLGVVVHCWRDARWDQFRCYVAFVGVHWPDGELSEEPYIAKHFTSSLQPLESAK
jgi:hypothetical protein